MSLRRPYPYVSTYVATYAELPRYGAIRNEPGSLCEMGSRRAEDHRDLIDRCHRGGISGKVMATGSEINPFVEGDRILRKWNRRRHRSLGRLRLLPLLGAERSRARRRRRLRMMCPVAHGMKHREPRLAMVGHDDIVSAPSHCLARRQPGNHRDRDRGVPGAEQGSSGHVHQVSEGEICTIIAAPIAR